MTGCLCRHKSRQDSKPAHGKDPIFMSRLLLSNVGKNGKGEKSTLSRGNQNQQCEPKKVVPVNK